jgi:hypothetical protein
MALPVPKRMQGQSRAHARAPYQERELAKATGGRVTPGSGNKNQKGDVRLKGFVRIECKTTIHASYSVTAATLRKLDDAVVGAGEVPILLVELELGKTKMVVMPEYALELVLEALRNGQAT